MPQAVHLRTGDTLHAVASDLVWAWNCYPSLDKQFDDFIVVGVSSQHYWGDIWSEFWKLGVHHQGWNLRKGINHSHISCGPTEIRCPSFMLWSHVIKNQSFCDTPRSSNPSVSTHTLLSWPSRLPPNHACVPPEQEPVSTPFPAWGESQSHPHRYTGTWVTGELLGEKGTQETWLITQNGCWVATEQISTTVFIRVIYLH